MQAVTILLKTFLGFLAYLCGRDFPAPSPAIPTVFFCPACDFAGNFEPAEELQACRVCGAVTSTAIAMEDGWTL